MRLERLEINGFGALRDRVIDFHPHVTIVVGGNESGKSTLHRAVRAALYGIDAGGQGRPVERSEWARWAPWTAGAYGVALTYTLEDGRRIRVARNLDSRDQKVQVLELGGSDLTDEVRSGRTVIPGLFHLGIDEAVFCATAWLSDESLRLGAADSPTARCDRLQEAIERLADTRHAVTAGEAIARLRDAMDRVGFERRPSSPLGLSSARLRDLDRRLDEARHRLQMLAAEQERLQELDRAAAAALRDSSAAERRFLAARLAAARSRLEQLESIKEEAAMYAAEAETSRHFAAFPLELEERAASLGGEVAHALRSASDARTRFESAQETLRSIRRRRAEIAAGIEAMQSVAIDDDTMQRAERLHGELTAAATRVEHIGAQPEADSRIAALKHEIARTGMGSLPIGSGEALAKLIDVTRQRPHALRWTAFAVGAALIGVVAALLLWAHHMTPAALISVSLGFAIASACAVVMLRSRRTSAELGAQVAELERAAGLTRTEVAAAAKRVPSLHALQAALAREQADALNRRREAQEAHAAVASICERAIDLAARAGLQLPSAGRGTSAAAMLETAREALLHFEQARLARRRCAELEAEDRGLASQEAELMHLQEDASRCSEIARQLQERLAHMLIAVGLKPSASPHEGVAAVRDACETRRRHDEALRGLASVQQRNAMLGDPALLRNAVQQMQADVQRVGGVDSAQDAEPPDDAELHRLEDAARHAAQAAISTSTQARELRARLDALLEAAPDIADLQNERDACAAARDRGLRQLQALQRAVELIESASMRTHRDLAPQIADRVSRRLAALTASRYVDVNVDTEHFEVSLLGRERPEMVPLALLSHGTRDQVSLLLRIALCEVLSTSSEPFPLLLDEPVLSADPTRRRQLLVFLHELSSCNQVLLTTSDPHVVDEAHRAGDADFSVVDLGIAQSVAETMQLPGRSARVRVV